MKNEKHGMSGFTIPTGQDKESKKRNGKDQYYLAGDHPVRDRDHDHGTDHVYGAE